MKKFIVSIPDLKAVAPVIVVLTVILSTGCSTRNVNPADYIDPTGTYTRDGETRKEGEDVYGYTGRIQVKRLTETRIVITFEVCKGAPSYNMGGFLDTLDYTGRQAIYTDPELDSSCRITFDFGAEGITVKEEADNFNFGCGFGHGVVADGFYRKTSGKNPVLEIPLTGEKLEK
jgi:hypothetical protein